MVPNFDVDLTDAEKHQSKARKCLQHGNPCFWMRIQFRSAQSPIRSQSLVNTKLKQMIKMIDLKKDKKFDLAQLH